MSKHKPSIRPIRSFAIRGRRLSMRQKHAIDHYWNEYGLDIAAGKLDFTEVFAGHAELVLEIGFGLGDSLAEMAKQNPHIHYIGVEVHRPGVAALLDKLAEQQISNVRIYHADVNSVLQYCIEDGLLSRVNIYFPDPWPKQRHHKRRLIQVDFLALLADKMQPQAKLYLATDWQDYANHMLKVAYETKDFYNANGPGKFAHDQYGRAETKFERRGKQLGHGVWDLVLVKCH